MSDDGSGSLPEKEFADFAPADLTDGREPYDWPTRWAPEARKHINIEAAYLVVLFVAIFGAIVVVRLKLPHGRLGLNGTDFMSVQLYAYAFLGGLLGGVLFALKWLYHSVAKGTWHDDRRHWRFLAPVNSAGLSFVVMALGRAGFLPISSSLHRPSTVLGVSFLVGYFSDHAIAAMTHLAERVFGERPGEHPPQGNARS